MTSHSKARAYLLVNRKECSEYRTNHMCTTKKIYFRHDDYLYILLVVTSNSWVREKGICRIRHISTSCLCPLNILSLPSKVIKVVDKA